MLVESAIRLLLIGNSLTAANDLPGMLRSMARAAGITIECTVIAKPDFSLEDHWNDGEARKAIARGGWTDVVLQQGPSALPESRVLLNQFVRHFDAEIRRVQARPALFMVWPSAARPGDFDAVSRSYAGAADLVDGVLLPAGDAWRAAWKRDPALVLYGPDGFHPARLGSYLAALTIFHRLTGAFPPRPSEISARDFEILRAAVVEVNPDAPRSRARSRGVERGDGRQQKTDSERRSLTARIGAWPEPLHRCSSVSVCCSSPASRPRPSRRSPPPSRACRRTMQAAQRGFSKR